METLVKIATIVVMTHGLRAIGQRLGPRWGGLVLGLPCSTAVVLFFLGRERGEGFAFRAAESGLLGLAAAVALAIAYASAINAGRRMPAALGLAVGAYLVVAAVARCAPNEGAAWREAVSLAAILAGARLAKGLGEPEERPGRLSPSRARSLALRTFVPIACLLTTTGLAGAIGCRWAGLLGTFPSTFLAVVIVTHLEGGPAVAVRTIRAFPIGNLSMVAFLAVFRHVGPDFGLVAATTSGYAAALTTLLAVEAVARYRATSPARGGLRAAADGSIGC